MRASFFFSLVSRWFSARTVVVVHIRAQQPHRLSRNQRYHKRAQRHGNQATRRNTLVLVDQEMRNLRRVCKNRSDMTNTVTKSAKPVIMLSLFCALGAPPRQIAA